MYLRPTSRGKRRRQRGGGDGGAVAPGIRADAGPDARAPESRAVATERFLEIDSLALVSLTIRLGEEFNVDVVDSGVELGQLETVGDLIGVAKKLQAL